MVIVLENEWLKVGVKPAGGELTEIFHKKNQLNYLFDGNPSFWSRQAPVLFPFVGRLKNDQYHYQGKTYPMGQHGFARDKVFQVQSQTQESVTLVLTDSKESQQVYPFAFFLAVTYTLKDDTLTVAYQVANPAETPLYFSLGAHPAFRLPLEENLSFEDYYLQFTPAKSRLALPLNGPFIDYNQRTIAATNTNMALTYDLFKNDALIFETNGPQMFAIVSEKSEHGVSLSYDGFDYVGFWTPYGKDAPFLCIEPWSGLADTVDTTGELTEKLDIQTLGAKETFEKSFTLHLF
ncbi:aldose 1-epimerase family protein [Enterococcus timonensis]|uniref:aldose 1-epimerase family protein n=1 Tax=Enterococcus timonensis TaxID=1852364 RepID=UPI0008DAB1DF|nr:aldose 1-epimerase family protein [Enterococcus timonensis]